MKKNKKFIVVFSIIAIICIGTLAYRIVNKNQKSSSKYSLYTVSEDSDLVFSAISKSDESQQVFNNQSYGDVEKVYVKDGQSVKKGDYLVSFVNKEVGKQIEQAKMQLDQSKSQVSYALEDRNTAYESYNKLIEQYNKSFSDELETQIDQMKPSINQAQRAYKQAIDQVNMQKKQLDDLRDSYRKTIKANVAGTVKVNEKDVNNPMSQSPIIEVTSSDNVIEGNISEYDYNNLKVNDKVEIIPINGAEKTTGIVTEISNSPESSIGSVNPNQMQNFGDSQSSNSSNFVFKIKTEKPVHVGFNVQVRKKSKNIIIGKDFVKEENSKFYVFEYKDSKAVKKEVQLEKNGESYTVISGLKSGDKIINNVADLKDNQEIKIES